MGSAFRHMLRGSGQGFDVLEGQGGDQADEVMVAPKTQFRQHLMGYLRPDRQHDGIASIEDCLVVGRNTHIRIAGREARRDLFVAGRKHNGIRILRDGLKPGDNSRGKRACADEAEFH